MGIRLFEHNQAAYDAAVSMLSEAGKAAVIHPTGTGKSFIGFKLCEDNPDKTVCWLSPSAYIFQTQLENLKNAADGYAPENICFFTYAKLMGMTEEELAAIQPDFIILDEFHRCGAEMWGTSVQTLLSSHPHVPVLGLSATAIRYLDNQRDMADELFDGNIASEMTLGEAIVRGILNPPKYVLSVFSYQKDLEKYQRKISHTRSKPVRDAAEKYLEALRRALDMADGLDEVFAKHMASHTGKYIVFCANGEHMQEMIGKVPEWFAKVDAAPHVYSAYSNDPETSQAFASFKADTSNHLKLLFCIDMLNEGIHVEDIDGVILLRPTVSPIIYKQQIGRALSATKSKHAVIFDIVNNIENIYSIGAIEEEMQIAAAYYRSLGESDAIVTEHFHVIDAVKDCRELFERLNDTLSASWNIMYSYAKAYYEEFGTLEISSRYRTKDGYSLGQWVFNQRAIRKGQMRGFLTDEQVRKLDEIGMVWDSVADLNWDRNFAAAETYFKEYGHLDVPAKYTTASGLKLGSWLSSLRWWKNAGAHPKYLTPERIEQLDNIGMIWDVLDYYWERNYHAAVEYYYANGDLDVPTKYVSPDGVRLGAWLATQRLLRDGHTLKGTPLTAEQIARLDAIGMNWSSRVDTKWEKAYKAAQQFYQKNHHLRVPVSYVDGSGVKLGSWIARQKRQYAAGTLSEYRVKRLEAIGMIWSNPDPWMTRYELVKQYYQEYGNLNIPQATVVDGFWIGKWLAKQRERYETGSSLSEEQRVLLSKLPFPHNNTVPLQWNSHFEEAKEYKERHGNLTVPYKFVTEKGTRLGVWLNNQRMKCNKGQLSQEQIRLLDSIGFTWKLENQWEQSFHRAEAYAQAHGDLNIARDYRCEDGYLLGIWIAKQRDSYKKSSLTQQQIDALARIGMVWEVVKPWEASFRKAEAYYLLHDHTLPTKKSAKTDEEREIATWVNSQRQRFNRGELTPETIKRLEVFHFSWMQKKEDPWEIGFRNAEEYYRTNGNLEVPAGYQCDNGYWLYHWIQAQRAKKDILSPEQISRLDSIGMIWTKEELWERNFQKAQLYYDHRGTLPLSMSECETETDRTLCRWLTRQRASHTQGLLTAGQTERLEAVGMVWNP